MEHNPWKTPSPIENVMAAFDARRIGADMPEPVGGHDERNVEYISVGDWLPGPDERPIQPDVWSWQRQVTFWTPLDKAARWYVNRHTPHHSYQRKVGRYQLFCVATDAGLAQRHATDDHRVTVWAGDDGRVIDGALDLLASRIGQIQYEAREVANRLSRQGVAAGFTDRPERTPLADRLAGIADALAGTDDAAEARRIVAEWDGTTRPEGRFKKLKRLARKHGVWRDGMRL